MNFLLLERLTGSRSLFITALLDESRFVLSINPTKDLFQLASKILLNHQDAQFTFLTSFPDIFKSLKTAHFNTAVLDIKTVKKEFGTSFGGSLSFLNSLSYSKTNHIIGSFQSEKKLVCENVALVIKLISDYLSFNKKSPRPKEKVLNKKAGVLDRSDMIDLMKKEKGLGLKKAHETGSLQKLALNRQKENDSLLEMTLRQLRNIYELFMVPKSLKEHVILLRSGIQISDHFQKKESFILLDRACLKALDYYSEDVFHLDTTLPSHLNSKKSPTLGNKNSQGLFFEYFKNVNFRLKENTKRLRYTLLYPNNITFSDEETYKKHVSFRRFYEGILEDSEISRKPFQAINSLKASRKIFSNVKNILNQMDIKLAEDSFDPDPHTPVLKIDKNKVEGLERFLEPLCFSEDEWLSFSALIRKMASVILFLFDLPTPYEITSARIDSLKALAVLLSDTIRLKRRPGALSVFILKKDSSFFHEFEVYEKYSEYIGCLEKLPNFLSELEKDLGEVYLTFLPSLGFFQMDKESVNCFSEKNENQKERGFGKNDSFFEKTEVCSRLDQELGDLFTESLKVQDKLLSYLFFRVFSEFFSLLSFLVNLMEDLDFGISVAEFANLLSLGVAEFSKASNVEDPEYSSIIKSSKEFRFENLYHPLLSFHTDTVIRNTFQFSPKNVFLLTGPNQSGKSTFVKSLCTAIVMGNVISYGSFSKAIIRPIKEILFAEKEGLEQGESYGLSFFEGRVRSVVSILEKIEAASGECEAEQSSILIVLDEFGKGTCLEDGFSLLVAIMNYLARKKLNCIAFFISNFSCLRNAKCLAKPIRRISMQIDWRSATPLYKVAEESMNDNEDQYMAIKCASKFLGEIVCKRAIEIKKVLLKQVYL